MAHQSTDPQAIQNLRRDYRASALDLVDLLPDPIQQFDKWLQEALAADLPEPNAMVLATVDPAGKPSARVVLLKGLSSAGLVFFTNFLSRKGREMAGNPQVALVFNWLELQRQVRIEGVVTTVSDEEATAYFQSRPKGSQIGASISSQSMVIPDRSVLEREYAALEAQYAGQSALPRPENWGGYRVRPAQFEFWQGRTNRLHDRLRYRAQSDRDWIIERLAP